MKPKEAFPKQTYKRLFDPWIKSTESRECLTIVNIPKRDQLYRINDLIIKKFSGKNTQIILIDLKGEIVEDPKDLDILINKKIDKKFKKIALIILDADQLLDEKYSLLSYLDKLYHDRPVLSLIYFFQKFFLLIEKQSVLRFFHSGLYIYLNLSTRQTLQKDCP